MRPTLTPASSAISPIRVEWKPTFRKRRFAASRICRLRTEAGAVRGVDDGTAQGKGRCLVDVKSPTARVSPAAVCRPGIVQAGAEAGIRVELVERRRRPELWARN